MIRPSDKEVREAVAALSDCFQRMPGAPALSEKFQIICDEVTYLQGERYPVQTVRIAPGDALVLTATQMLSKEEQDRLRFQVECFLARLNLKDECPVVVLDGGMRLGVVENGSATNIEIVNIQRGVKP